MTSTGSQALLPSISHLLKRAGALEFQGNPDLGRIAALPVFQTEAWKQGIKEFLRWSGSTPTHSSGASVFALLLGHGRPGAFSLYLAFRNFLMERRGDLAEARASLQAVRTVVTMASYWSAEVDWNLDGAPDLTPEDFEAPEAPPAPAGLRAGADEIAPLPPPVPRVVRAVEPAEPKRPEGRPVEVRVPPNDFAVPLFRNDPTVRSLWSRSERTERPSRPDAPPPPPGSPTSRDRPGT